ncbi:M42 family peptidase [Mycoplasmatota bacterium]|nr:M42 family peptidase [Mycoplasmatota bacterium]
MNKDFLYEMLKTSSPTGDEYALQKKVIDYMSEFDIQTDYTGNVISCLNTESNFKVLLAGHIDEIAFMVSHVTDDGLLKVVKAGGVKHELAQGRRVNVLGYKKSLKGVFGVCTNDKGINTDAKEKDLFIDLGFSKRDEVLEYVRVGDYVVYSDDVDELANNRIAGRGLDNRLGAFIVVESLKKAKEKNTSVGVYSATTVGEESTMRGAFWAVEKIRPDFALIVDVTFSTDYPGTNPSKSGKVKLDNGPVLAKSSIINNKINAKLEAIAGELGINIQWEVAPGRTGTDGDKIHQSVAGVPLALVSIPLRYMHSPGEVGSLKDVEEIIELISEFLSRIDSDFDINPFK